MSICTQDNLAGGVFLVISNLQSYKSGIAFRYGPMKSWAGGGPLILVYIHTHTHDKLDKLRSALAEAKLKTISEEDRAR